MEKQEKRSNDNKRCLPSASIRAKEGEGNERKFILSFSSEEPYERHWGIEVLDHGETAVDLTRLEEIGCILFNHKRDIVIGKVNEVWIEKARGCAEVEFDTDEESEKIYQKVLSGTLKGVSVGYTVSAWETVSANKTSSDGRFTGPAEIAKKWMPYEISIVSVPADASVGVGRDLEEINGNNADQRTIVFFEKQLQINKNLGGY